MLEDPQEERQGVALECLTLVGDALCALGKQEDDDEVEKPEEQ